MDIRKFIQESFEKQLPGDPPSEESHKNHQERFDSAIYVAAENIGLKLKRVPKEDFYYNLRISDLLHDKKKQEFDKTSIYRMADSATKWLSRNNVLLGVFYEETDEWGDHVESYWLNKEVFKLS